jgi:superfamily II DNA or RNA helicase
MERDTRIELRAVIETVADWSTRAQSVRAHRQQIDQAAQHALVALRSATVGVPRDGTSGWQVLPLQPNDTDALTAVARRTQLPPLAAQTEQDLGQLTNEVAAALRDVRSVVGARRLFSGAKKKDGGRTAAGYLSEYHGWGTQAALVELLESLSPARQTVLPSIGPGEALADWVGLAARTRDLGGDPEVLPVAVLAGLPGAVRVITKAVQDEARFRTDAIAAGDVVRRQETRKLLADMPVERLREATRDRLRIGPLSDAGINTVLAVLDHGARLENLPGIGGTTATRMRGAAQTLMQTTYEEMPTRLDINNRTAETTELLRRLCAWDAMRRTKGAAADLLRCQELSALASTLHSKVTHIVLFHPSDQSTDDFHATVQAVLARATNITAVSTSRAAADPWEDFLARPADYFAMLAELGFLLEDEKKTHGDLPDDIVEAVRALELDTEYLTASLRGYQSFAARFALVQRKVIIGDEMGLGKTVEALAVLAHLRAMGQHHSLVVCPAAVVTNWTREVASKSTLRAHRVHGGGRDAAVRSWVRQGGVAVTTFETLAWLQTQPGTDLSCVIVDEAHYIKNPAAQRSRRAASLINSCERAILLTGTPLENRIEEFRNLVCYLRPDLVIDASELAPRKFRRQVAPAYLRRNQEDVLTELPELVEVEEWLPLSSEDMLAYREAVAAGNFMAMRQAAMTHRTKSEKLQRLIDIVEEAEDNGRRVIVFSHFRDTLDLVARALPGEVFGPLTGSVPAAARQVMVDQFSAAGHGAVLVAQIIAGGVGLNIQAASVVVICEPQLKPTTEWQAIARAHRMGQLQSVQVHRLLSEEGVDARVTQILARKRELFDEFARTSDTAASAPEAFDVSEAELAREVIAAERERLFSHLQPREPAAEAVLD